MGLQVPVHKGQQRPRCNYKAGLRSLNDTNWWILTRRDEDAPPFFERQGYLKHTKFPLLMSLSK